MAEKLAMGNAYLTLPRAPETWLVEPLLPVGGLMNIYGAPKGGKSYLALQLAIDVAQGNPDWLGFAVKQHGPVAYIQLDTPRSLWAERLDAMEKDGIPIDRIGWGDSQQAPYPYDILTPESMTWLRQVIAEGYQPEGVARAIPYVLVVIDTLREIHRGDENDSAQMQKVMATLQAAIRPCAMIIVSHSRKDNAERGEDLLNDNRGSSYVAGRMDSILRVSKKQMSYTGRAVASTTVPLRRLPNNLWGIGSGEEERLLQVVLDDGALATLKDKAEMLASRLNITFEAARNRLRRRMGDGREVLDTTAGAVATAE